MAQKSNIRSMRFSDEIIRIIESQEGETFTSKFENLVRKCITELPQKEKQLEYINKEIDQLRKKHDQIRTQAFEMSNKISTCKYVLERMEYEIKRATENLKTTIDNP